MKAPLLQVLDAVLKSVEEAGGFPDSNKEYSLEVDMPDEKVWVVRGVDGKIKSYTAAGVTIELEKSLD